MQKLSQKAPFFAYCKQSKTGAGLRPGNEAKVRECVSVCVEEVEGGVTSLPHPRPPGSLVSQLPSLNFVIYLPKRTEYPLQIQQDQRSKVTPTNAFLVPQWGGVVVYNPPEMGSGQDMELQREPVAQNKLNVSVRMEELMPLIIGQLKMLLGVPVHVSHRSYVARPSLVYPFSTNVGLNGQLPVSNLVLLLVTWSLLPFPFPCPFPCSSSLVVLSTLFVRQTVSFLLLTFYPQVPQRETFSFAPGEHGITDWVSADIDPSKFSFAPSSSFYPPHWPSSSLPFCFFFFSPIPRLLAN